ncbi:unnamed protein product [Malus baccata var. baccata]
MHYLSGGAWDPHDMNAVAATCESSIQFWDLRTMKYITAEDESGIHVWDLRKPKVPIQELPGHTHWTWAARYNPEYDGLILSSGTDSAVNLWFASPYNNDESERLVDSPTRRIDPLLNSYSDYEDSIYGLAWSSREPWIFASLSYDGRVVVESVKPFLSKK